MTKKIADLSYHQGNINFALAKEELALAIIRVQYGTGFADPKYREYVSECKEHGIPFGHYAYALYKDVAGAIEEAKMFLARADKDAEFLVVDVEEQTCRNPRDLVPATQAFIDYLHNHGVKKVGLYTGHSFYTEHGMGKVKADFLWIPRYAMNDNGTLQGVRPNFACDIHQFTQNGRLKGVAGAVDLNVLCGSKSLAYFTGADKVEAKPVKKPAPKPVEKPTPAKKPTSSVKASDGVVYDKHTVKSGENLTLIAKKYGVSIADIQKLNSIKDANKISEGQILKIKKKAPVKPAPKPAPKPVKKPAVSSKVYGVLTVTCEKLRLHDKPSLASETTKIAVKGDKLNVLGMKNGLYVLEKDMYVTSSDKYVRFTKNPAYKK